MEYKLLKSLLNYNFYLLNKANLSSDIFTDEAQELYEVIKSHHDKRESDLTTSELLALWTVANPVATSAERSVIDGIIVSLTTEQPMSDDVSSEVIKLLWKQQIGRKIANYGISISENNDKALPKLKKLLEEIDGGFTPEVATEEVTKDLSKLLALTSDDNRYQFNIPSLSNRVYGLGKGEFGIAFARPETGKTAFVISLAAAPNGFAAQGAKVLYLGNEENPERTMLRAYQAYTGMSRDDIVDFPERAIEKFNEISDNLIIFGIHGWFDDQVEALIERIKPDVVLIDQYDKVAIHDDTIGHERLGTLYVNLRAMCTRQNVAMLGLSQASVEAEGRTILTPNMMEGSKTRKYAEADLIIGIGKHPDAADGTPEPIRYLTVGKNKLSGSWHGTLTCKFTQEISRYES
jgi:hypothetical protein